MFKLFIRKTFTDTEIECNDGSKFFVHKIILLTRFDNEESIYQKFVEICKEKPKEDVQFAINFLYTGFPHFIQIRKTIMEEKLDTSYEMEKFQKDQKSLWKKKKTQVKALFKEIGLKSKWVHSKQGRKGLLKDLHSLYHQESTKDFAILFEKGKQIKIHKIILVLRSDLYKGMFQSVKKQSNQVYDYSGKSYESLNQMIYYFYHDEFDESKLNPHIIEELENVKEYYKLNPSSNLHLN
ncbi:speckle-type poz protein [Anaeramoeba ignava]|uniref:Speckle-type poz protein n=1 Tax=Anaeramoeba ignava TaxID=1746090 RepID=A0A9Q0LUN7_ANAIG|nr:speckle-type poz protein [Anaeramoeba ignava]